MTYIVEELEKGKHSREINSYSSLDKALKDLLILIEAEPGNSYRLWKEEENIRQIVEIFKGEN